jgi:DNA-binding transcriptional ArsR family regulator
MTEIKELHQIRALASPRRQAIVDALDAIGPCPIADLASVLGSREDGLYYHIRALKAAGLVTESTVTNGRGRPRLVLDLVGRPLQLRYTPRNQTAISRLVAHMLRDTSRSFDKGFHKSTRMHGPARELFAGRRNVWLTRQDLVRLHRVLQDFWASLDHEMKGQASRRLYSFTYVLSPLTRSKSHKTHRRNDRRERTDQERKRS